MILGNFSWLGLIVFAATLGNDDKRNRILLNPIVLVLSTQIIFYAPFFGGGG